MTTETENADLRRLTSERDWDGYLTLENFGAVVNRLRAMLAGQRYTWVSCNEGQRDFFPEVRTGQRLTEDIHISRSVLDDGRHMAHLTAVDHAYVWGLDTTIADQRAARELAGNDKKRQKLTRLHFGHGHYDEGRLEVEQYNGYGNRLYWVIAVESEERR